MAEKVVRVSITMTPELLAMADEAAAELGVNRSTYIGLAVREKNRLDTERKNMPAIMMQAAQMMQMLTDLDRRGLLTNDPPLDLSEFPALDPVQEVTP